MIGLFGYLLGMDIGFSRYPQPFERNYSQGHDRGRKHHWSKEVQRRRKHRSMRKAMRQMLRRR